VPYVDGFGLAAFVRDDNTALLASVQGSNHIYKFTSAAGIYNTTPVNVFNFFGKKILGNSSLSRWAAQDNSGNVRVFDSDTLTQTITGADLDFALKGDYLATANFSSQVKIWKYETGAWSVVKTITSATTNFGYSLSFNSAYDLLVGSPNESTSFLYSFSDNWTTPKSFVSTGLYGYTNALTADSVLISNYTDQLEFYSSDGASIPQIITDVRQKKASVTLSTNLDNTDAQVLVFSSSSALTIDSIATDIQGLWLGCLMYNRQLTTAEIQGVETNIYEYLGLAERSFYG
jgi:WD40 repeat protein